jgi:hypothetical protein
MKAIVINGCCKAEDLQVSEVPSPKNSGGMGTGKGTCHRAEPL